MDAVHEESPVSKETFQTALFAAEDRCGSLRRQIEDADLQEQQCTKVLELLEARRDALRVATQEARAELSRQMVLKKDLLEKSNVDLLDDDDDDDDDDIENDIGTPDPKCIEYVGEATRQPPNDEFEKVRVELACQTDLTKEIPEKLNDGHSESIGTPDLKRSDGVGEDIRQPPCDELYEFVGPNGTTALTSEGVNEQPVEISKGIAGEQESTVLHTPPKRKRPEAQQPRFLAKLEANANPDSKHNHKPTLVVGRPVGLPNRGRDCAWLSTLQCLRHTPGFVDALQLHFNVDEQLPAGNLAEASAKLMKAIELAETRTDVLQGLKPETEALGEFRLHAMEGLSADGRRVVQWDAREQRQQDAHEFLGLLLNHLGDLQDPGGVSSPRTEANLPQVEWLESELTQAFQRKDTAPSQKAWHIQYEYSMIQWAASVTRMKSRSLSAIFEGQRLETIKCLACGRFVPTGAEPFTIEEIRLVSQTKGTPKASSRANGNFIDSEKLREVVPGRLFNAVGRIRKVSSSLRGDSGSAGESKANTTKLEECFSVEEMLVEALDCPAPDSYRCPNAACGRVGCSVRSGKYLRLPAVLILHVNRAMPDGSRCGSVLEFAADLDLASLGVVALYPASRSLELSNTNYSLFAVVFHRGKTARSGHYFTYLLHRDYWFCVDDSGVRMPTDGHDKTPALLEKHEPQNGAKAVLLFYRRKQ